jgi:hypothetical protein
MVLKKASVADYIVLQGGVPQISKDDKGLFHIKHLYREDEPEVVTHISPKERGTVIINNIVYEVAKLWRFEGGPCEAKSTSVGGRGYDRKG